LRHRAEFEQIQMTPVDDYNPEKAEMQRIAKAIVDDPESSDAR